MASRGCDLLKIGRRIRGITQQDVADSYGVHVKTYRKWEKGETAVPYDALVAICDDVFRLPVEKINEVTVYAS
ncbi:XRE family transcriptional regulator [Parashewanella curva]|uniref:XRE family transcriptional regulator n=1 Tax=Parashewanella curva TaxID=2338552 RepID=A0A3L8Q295_9GAMM|nr:helix-turn-helix transcriptional regulator [Parashewanella curva]RLV60988.1 XRE family transcriptional regulator [Parashewanella curva]